MAYSANQTKLAYKNGEKYKAIEYLMEVPEFGGTPEKIDVTTLGDSCKQYIPGIKDFGDLVFKFLYQTGSDGNYSLLQKMEEAYESATGSDKEEKVADFVIIYPDGTAHQFKAIPAVKMDAGAINGALTFSATMTLQGGIKLLDTEVELEA